MADDRFKDSLAGLSRVLSERAASHPDPVGEAMERRAALLAQFDKQEHQTRWLLVGGAAAALASAGVTILILFLVWPPGSPSPVLPSIGAPATRAAPVVAAEPPPPPIALATAPAP